MASSRILRELAQARRTCTRTQRPSEKSFLALHQSTRASAFAAEQLPCSGLASRICHGIGRAVTPDSMSGYRPKGSGFVASARCATWKAPDCEEAVLGSYLDPTKDPPSELILTDDVRGLQDDLLFRFAEPPAEAPTWSRLRDQRKPPAEGSSPSWPIPSKLCLARSGLENAGQSWGGSRSVDGSKR